MIIDHNTKAYRRKWYMMGSGRYNGAYYYSREIVERIIPNVETDRNWITINVQGLGCDHAIVFIHNNDHPELYDHLKEYKDLILVCGVPETCEKVAHLGTPIYLPLSIDVDFVSSLKVTKAERIKEAAYAGRSDKKTGDLPKDVDLLEDMDRYQLLQAMARYKTIYAVGRTAIEAKALGCKLKAYDPRYPKVSVWKVVDNLEAAKMLQEKLDEIDGERSGSNDTRDNTDAHVHDGHISC